MASEDLWLEVQVTAYFKQGSCGRVGE